MTMRFHFTNNVQWFVVPGSDLPPWKSDSERGTLFNLILNNDGISSDELQERWPFRSSLRSRLKELYDQHYLRVERISDLFNPIGELEMGAPAPLLPAPLLNETKIDKPLTGLWRHNSETPEGKYLVQRRDGTVVEWPNFVLGARDPASVAALTAYAGAAEALGYNPKFVEDLRRLAEEFKAYRAVHGKGDPDRGRHRIDDPATVEKMKTGRSA